MSFVRKVDPWKGHKDNVTPLNEKSFYTALHIYNENINVNVNGCF